MAAVVRTVLFAGGVAGVDYSRERRFARTGDAATGAVVGIAAAGKAEAAAIVVGIDVVAAVDTARTGSAGASGPVGIGFAAVSAPV